MQRTDFDEFSELWSYAWSQSGRNLTPSGVILAFEALSDLTIDEVKRALTAHMRDTERGRFPPTVSDVIAAVRPNGISGWLSADEAWGICVKTFDEDDTVVVTDEIMQARELAQPIMNIGDEVGARLAFRDTYERLVAKARFDGRVPRWWATFGSNRELRATRVDEAISMGRLPLTARKQIPGPAPDIGDAMRALKLMADRRPNHREEIEKARGMLAALKDRLETKQTAEDAARRMQRETERLQAEARRKDVVEAAERKLSVKANGTTG